jgi:hypothetical protein
MTENNGSGRKEPQSGEAWDLDLFHDVAPNSSPPLNERVGWGERSKTHHLPHKACRKIGHAFPQPGKSQAMGFAALNPSYMLYHR